MKKQELILVGGGGHCKSVIDVIEEIKTFTIRGILDVKEKVGSDILGYKVIGTDDHIAELNNKNVQFIITLGQIKNAGIKKKIFEQLKYVNASLATLISPLAHVSKHTEIKEGTAIMHQAMVNAGAVIGVNCIVNSKVLIEHDVKIGDHCHISTSAVINGDCVISNNCFIGSNAVLLHGVKIGEGAVIGAGAVIIKDILPNQIVVGNPGRSI